MKEISRHTRKILYIIGLIVIFAIWFRVHTYKITLIPLGLHIDEAGVAYDAYCISNWGVDRYLNPFPVYFVNTGGGMSALAVYLCAFFMKFMGTGSVVVRIPAILFGLITLICGYVIINKKYGYKWAMVGAFLITILPYFIQQARFGLDCNLMLGAVTLALMFMIIALEKGNWWLYALDGLLWGLVLYTYAVSYFVVPAFLFLALIYLLAIRKVDIRKVLISGACLFVMALPLIVMLVINYLELDSIITPWFSISNLPIFRGDELSGSSIIYNIKNLLYSIFYFDEFSYNSLIAFHSMYLISIPLCAIGAVAVVVQSYKAIRNKKFDITVLITIYTFVQFIFGSLRNTTNINNMNAVFFPLVYLIIVALKFIYQFVQRIVKQVEVGKIIGAGVLVVILLAYVINFVEYYNYYFYVHPEAEGTECLFTENMSDVIEQYENLCPKDRIVYVDAFYIHYAIGKKLAPHELIFDENNEVTQYGNLRFVSIGKPLFEEIDTNAIYIMRDRDYDNVDLLYGKFENVIRAQYYSIYFN